MSVDKSIEEFERHTGIAWGDASLAIKTLWQVSWQASRAAVAVDLPKPYLKGYTENGNHPPIDLYDGSELIPALEAAGLKVSQ